MTSTIVTFLVGLETGMLLTAWYITWFTRRAGNKAFNEFIDKLFEDAKTKDNEKFISPIQIDKS